MKDLEKKSWGLVAAFLVGGCLVIMVVILAKRGVSEGTINEVLDKIYAFGEEHVWEISGVSSLVTGIWFSIARRRIVLSVFCLALAFLFSFVLPNLF